VYRTKSTVRFGLPPLQMAIRHFANGQPYTPTRSSDFDQTGRHLIKTSVSPLCRGRAATARSADPPAPHLRSYAGDTTATAQNILQFERSFSRSIDQRPSLAAVVESAPFPPKQLNARFAMAGDLIASAVTERVAISGSRC
jgi:hypothetical protein